MIRTNTKQVTLDFSDGNYSAGELEFSETGGEGHGGLARLSERVTLPIRCHVLGVPDAPAPGVEDPAVVIHSTPIALEEFCKDVLAKLAAANDQPGKEPAAWTVREVGAEENQTVPVVLAQTGSYNPDEWVPKVGETLVVKEVD